jgi:uncharacterized RDD family membrane protein YckC
MSPHQPSAFGQFGENHSIETPEQTRLEFAIAGIGSRFLALALDLILQAIVVIVVLIVVSVIERFIAMNSLWEKAALIALLFALHYGYFIAFEILWSGQTPGKRKVGIRVVKDSGRPLTATETIARNLMRIVDEVPGVYAVGIVTALLNAQNRRLGDFVAGSLVIREGSLAEMRPAWSSGQSGQPAPVAGALRLSVEELALIETFLARRSELPADVRSRMASGILRKLQQKSPAGIELGLSTESTLERLAYECRSTGGYA